MPVLDPLDDLLGAEGFNISDLGLGVGLTIGDEPVDEVADTLVTAGRRRGTSGTVGRPKRSGTRWRPKSTIGRPTS